MTGLAAGRDRFIVGREGDMMSATVTHRGDLARATTLLEPDGTCRPRPGGATRDGSEDLGCQGLATPALLQCAHGIPAPA